MTHGRRVLVAFSLSACVVGASHAKLLFVPNTVFDPVVDPSGLAPFVGIGAETVASPLGADYWIVQRDQRMNAAWRTLLTGQGAQILAVFPEDAVLVRVEEAGGGGLAGLPTALWAGRFRTSYKVSAGLAPFFDEGATTHLLDADGKLRLMVALHPGEDVGAFEASVLASVPQAEVISALTAQHVGSEGSLPRLALRVGAAAAVDVISALARHEAVFQMETWGNATLALDDSVWYAQTSLPPALAPADPSIWRYDATAKLFARGVTGRGQVYASLDSGIDNDDCHLRYGPNVSDTTQVVPASVQPPAVVGPGDPAHRAGNKVIAYYQYDSGVAWCPPQPYEDPTAPHGTSTAGCAIGDHHFVSAAEAGKVLDDPSNDEEPAAASQDYALLIDHHQRSDGMAPGAQAIIQDVNFTCPVPNGETWPPPRMADLLQQAYDTSPGARVHNDSWGAPIFYYRYTADARDLDRQAWRLRDMLVVFCAHNHGPGPLSLADEANFKDGITVGATRAGNFAPGGGPTPDMAAFSSHGPGWPDRVKPDVVLPGDAVFAPFPPPGSPPETGIGDGDNACGIQPRWGTSYSAPTLAGLALDARQYYVDGYYPGGGAGSSAGFVPTNALLKAVLVNSTRDTGGEYTADDGTGGAGAPRPTFGQGWGHPVLDDALYFAGDPTHAGERSFTVVLNDVPNGLTAAANDARATILDSFQPAIGDLDVHSFSICVNDGEDLHVTLAWSDVAGTPAAGAGVPPLRNDLDLEIVDPAGQVWRPDPRTAVWSNGASVLAPPAQDSTGNGPDRGNPNWAPGAGDSSVIDEDFLDADRSNPIENVFISAANADFVAGTWTIHVMGFDVQGNGELPTLASPNFDDSDGDLEFDTILDTDQGYALVVSGDVATARRLVSFDESTYSCGAMARVLVRDCSGGAFLPPFVEVTTEAGDCDRFALTALAAPAFMAQTDPFLVADVDDGTAPGTCVASDGIVVSPDDSALVVTYQDTVPDATWTSRATARVTCRDVAFDEATVVDPCEVATQNGLLNPNEIAAVHVRVQNVGLHPVSNLRGDLHPSDEAIQPLLGGAAFRSTNADPTLMDPGDFATAIFPVFAGSAMLCDPAEPPRFRCELSGDAGFQDRVWFEIPVDCTPGLVGDLVRPGEVPAIDSVAPPTTGLRARKPGTMSLVNTELRLEWDDAPGAIRYNIWRGQLASLANDVGGGFHDHAVPVLPSNPFCNVADLPGPNSQTLAGEAVYLGLPGSSHYYLVTGENQCGSGASLITFDGPWGFADRDLDGVNDADETIPPGALLDMACSP